MIRSSSSAGKCCAFAGRYSANGSWRRRTCWQLLRPCRLCWITCRWRNSDYAARTSLVFTVPCLRYLRTVCRYARYYAHYLLQNSQLLSSCNTNHWGEQPHKCTAGNASRRPRNGHNGPAAPIYGTKCSDKCQLNKIFRGRFRRRATADGHKPRFLWRGPRRVTNENAPWLRTQSGASAKLSIYTDLTSTALIRWKIFATSKANSKYEPYGKAYRFQRLTSVEKGRHDCDIGGASEIPCRSAESGGESNGFTGVLLPPETLFWGASPTETGETLGRAPNSISQSTNISDATPSHF